jgi:hypothetical protein
VRTFDRVLDPNPAVHDALRTRVAVIVQARRVLPDHANLFLELRRVVDEDHP